MKHDRLISYQLTVALALLLAVAGTSHAKTIAEPLILHHAVGDTIDATEAAQWGLFPDLGNLSSAVFQRTSAGNIIVRIQLDGRGDSVVRERSIPAKVWAMWQADLEAGRTASDFQPPEPGLVWPETPLLPGEFALPAEPFDPADARTSLAGEWVMQFDLGYKHSTTVFNTFFTDMAMIQMGFGYAMNDYMMPFFGFQTGFGDLIDAFEDVTANGKSAIYAFELGTRLNLPLTDRTSIGAAVAGGYYMRSLRWGGDLFFSQYGTIQGGASVRELSDWGGSVRLGLQHRLGSRPGPPVFVDLSVRYEAYGADESLLADPLSGAEIRAINHDRWVAVSLGLIFKL